MAEDADPDTSAANFRGAVSGRTISYPDGNNVEAIFYRDRQLPAT
jgi:hypothetical protein